MTAKVEAILIANGIVPGENAAKQYGVPGMKWGQRKRRPTASSPSTAKPKTPPSTSRKETVKVQRTTDRARGAGKAGSFTQKPQNRRMSDAELRNRLNRLQMEKQYRELTTSPKGKSFVREVLADTGKQVARQALKQAGNVALQMALESAAKNSKGSTKVFLSAMAATGKGKKKD